MSVDLGEFGFVNEYTNRWPVIQPGPTINLRRRKIPAQKLNGDWLTAVVYPDMQIGYFRDVDGELQPTHDETAIALAHAITRRLNPDVVVFNGDNLDLPEQSKYRHSPAWQQTTQPTIDRATQLCAETRDAAPHADIYWLEGNHELRLSNYILDNASAAFGLRRGSRRDSWPVFSIPELCRFDDQRVTYLPGYPANVHWLNDRLKIIHGHYVRSNGSTAYVYLGREKVSTIYGHVHRREWAEVTRQDRDGPKTILAASAGCLARIDGAVPSVKAGMDLDGRPIKAAENWQQGICVVSYQPGDGPFAVEMVAIHEGRAVFRGREYEA